MKYILHTEETTNNGMTERLTVITMWAFAQTYALNVGDVAHKVSILHIPELSGTDYKVEENVNFRAYHPEEIRFLTECAQAIVRERNAEKFRAKHNERIRRIEEAYMREAA